MTKLADSCIHRYSYEVKQSCTGFEDTEVEEDMITCGHRSNTYTVVSSCKSVKTSKKGHIEKATGKRIDFVLYRFVQEPDVSLSINEFHHMCHSTLLRCEGKDPMTGLSFSDHQPVIVNLMIKKRTKVLGGITDGSVLRNGFNDSGLDAGCDSTSIDTMSTEEEENVCLTNNGRPRKSSKVLLDIIPGKRFGNSKDQPKMNIPVNQNVATGEEGDSSSSLMSDTHSLLQKYIEDIYVSKQRSLLIILLVVIVLVCGASVASFMLSTSGATLFHWWMASVVVGVFLVLLTELNYRFERTAVKGISEEIACMLSLSKCKSNARKCE